MKSRYMLDTNTASYAIKGNSLNVRSNLQKVAIAAVCISAVSEAELRFGVLRKHNPPKLATGLDVFLTGVGSLPWDSAAAVSYARLRVAMEEKGTPIGNIDIMIAAHALSIDAVLVTHDHVFRHIRDLRLEDWA